MATLQSLKKNSAPFFHEVLSDKMLVALTRPRCLYVKNLLVTVFCVLFGAYVREGATLLFSNKKTPKGVYAGCVGVRKNYRYVEWQWKVE